MGLLSKILGTIEQSFQIGLGGPRLKVGVSAMPQSTIDARDASDSAYAIVRVADPQQDYDAVNLRTLNALLAPPVAADSTLYSHGAASPFPFGDVDSALYSSSPTLFGGGP